MNINKRKSFINSHKNYKPFFSFPIASISPSLSQDNPVQTLWQSSHIFNILEIQPKSIKDQLFE